MAAAAAAAAAAARGCAAGAGGAGHPEEQIPRTVNGCTLLQALF